MEQRARTRNICILAHVDHGKTTLADHLIAGAGGGVIHPKQAGKLRYLDYRDDEQQRAITMKSASICLKFRNHNINLIDSPGHVDFCSEVSTAVRLSDGALLLVDVCEGVHIQTHAVLRQAWMEHVKPCLVLNKIDRLITELKMTPMEAYTRMQGIISEVNNIVSGLRSEKYLSDVDSILAGPVERGGDTEASSEEADLDDPDDENDEFVPQRGNVVFCSAIDGWAFRTDQFAELYAAKLGASTAALKKALWGDYYYHPKTKKIVGKKVAAGKLKPMFVQCVLEPLWQVYGAVMQGKEGTEMLNKVIKSMHLTIPPRELQNRDVKVVLQAVMSRWLPLPDGILSMVLEVLPDPASAQPARMARLFPKRLISPETTQAVQAEIEAVRKSIEACDDREDAPCVVFVSKMFAVPVEMVPRDGTKLDLNFGDTDASSRECFLAFARVFSGVLSVGQQLHILSPLYDPTDSQSERKHLQLATMDALYLMMGRGLEPCDKVAAGNVVAIRGLGPYILKSATLSSTQYCWPFASLSFQAAPIVRVAVEPSDPANITALSKGLKLLNRADPFVEVSLSATGEHVISAAGEVHLELCIKDLRERFACVDLEVSPPLVAFKETIEGESLDPAETQNDGYVEVTTPNGRCTVRVHVSRMPTSVIQILDESADTLKSMTSGKKKLHGEEGRGDPISVMKSRLLAAVESERSAVHQAETEKRRTKDFKSKLKRIWTLGPRHVGPNILLVPAYCSSTKTNQEAAEVRGFPHVSELLGFEVDRPNQASLSSLELEAQGLEGSIVSAFQLATAAGPLCEEPMWGLIFTVEAYISEASNESLDASGGDRFGPFSGQVITAVREACRSAMFSKRPRLVEAMYLCEVNTTSQYLGQMYGVLARRRARVLKEEMREGTAMFTVHAFVPVAESFGFAEELRRKTSGAASAQLMLSHWEALAEDPFFVPKTEEELEEFGDGASVPQSTARKLIDAVRRRKGLPVEEKVVRHATKQRTLARKV